MARKSIPSSEYWAKRSLERTTAAEMRSAPYLKMIQRTYRETAKYMTGSIQRLYAAYYSSAGKTFDIATLQDIAPRGSLTKLKSDMERLGLDTRLPDNYRGRINRLQLMNLQAWAEVKKAALQEQNLSRKMYGSAVEDAYYRTIFDTANKLGKTQTFSTLDTKTVNKVLSTKFYGKNYSERIWTNTDTLANNLNEIISKAVATGQPQEVTIREIQERFSVSASNAARLVRTEICYFENQGELESYREIGVEKFKFLATLDSRTSEICRNMDGKIFSVKDAKQGVNVPPLHPYCRSTIVPYISKELEPKQRIARDPATERNYYVQGDMNYESWHKSLVEDIAHKIDSRVPITGITKVGMIKTGMGVNFDAPRLTKIDGDLLRDTVNSADHLLNMFPNVKEWVEEQGGLVITSTNSGAIATTNRNKPIISLSNNYYHVMKKLLNTTFKGAKRGWFMPTANYKSYTFTHEFGHLLENYLLRGKNTEAEARRIRSDIISIAARESKLNRKEVLKLASKYALQNNNPREFFAEVFANAFMGKPNALGKAMRTYLKGEMKK